MNRFLLAQEPMCDALAVGQAATVYTDSKKFRSTTGYSVALIKSTAGSITVTFQLSLDDINWYDPVDKDNTALGEVAATMTVGSRYAIFSPQPGQYIRFKIVEGNSAPTAVTITLLYTE